MPAQHPSAASVCRATRTPLTKAQIDIVAPGSAAVLHAEQRDGTEPRAAVDGAPRLLLGALGDLEAHRQELLNHVHVGARVIGRARVANEPALAIASGNRS